MKLTDLCPLCDDSGYDPTKYDEYGDVIVPKLCEEEVIEKSVITDVLVQKIKPFDTMLETNEMILTTKNKLYCGE